jgi:hypothetical protein
MGYKAAVALVLLLLIAGCASTQVVEHKRVYERDEVKPYIIGYMQKYGEPYVSLWGRNYLTGGEYVSLVWEINGQDYVYTLIWTVEDGWQCQRNDFRQLRGV